MNVGKPRVVHRETIQKRVECEGLFERELGEKKHFGHVKLILEPTDRGGGVEIVRRLEEGAVIPEELLVAMEEGVREGVLSGVLAGYPVIDIRIVLLGGTRKREKRRRSAARSPPPPPFGRAARRPIPCSWGR